MKWSYLLLPLLVFACNNQGAPLTREPGTGGRAPAVATENAPAPPDILFGELFRRVQMERVFADGKTFVDMIPKRSPEAIMGDYATAKEQPDFDPERFVEQNFDPPASYESSFESDEDRTVTEHINALWPVLTRAAGAGEGDDGSLLPLPNNYVVPGGRFREVYYWDSYFTMLGLREAGRTELIRDMVENFAYLIDRYGFIPNGNRTYYLTRSQPPFFSHMVELLADIEGGEVYREFYPQLEAEYAFWMKGAEEVSTQDPAVNHVVRMPDGSLLNRYYDAGDRPRAESYREDVLTIRESGRDSQLVARHLRSGAESGWDYSSRWFADGEDISSIITTDIVPPDLNSLLFHLERTLERYATERDASYAGISSSRGQAMQQYLWNERLGRYEDYNWKKEAFTGRISLAGMYPFFVRIPGELGADAGAAYAKKAVALLRDTFLMPGGVRATPYATGQQWDAPNGWPPLQWITYRGLTNYGYDELAADLRRRWLDNNERVYENVGKMVEKYNVEDITLEAGGGEYPVQDGFGWSNGVYLGLE